MLVFIQYIRDVVNFDYGNLSWIWIIGHTSPVTGEFPTQRPVTRSFDVFFDLRLNKRLSKHSWGWGFETPSCPLWHHCNVIQRTRMTSKRTENYRCWRAVRAHEQSGRSPKVVAPFLLQTLVAIWYDFFNCMMQSKWNQIIQELTIIIII